MNETEQPAVASKPDRMRGALSTSLLQHDAGYGPLMGPSLQGRLRHAPTYQAKPFLAYSNIARLRPEGLSYAHRKG
jgi:hypothetical protein